VRHVREQAWASQPIADGVNFCRRVVGNSKAGANLMALLRSFRELDEIGKQLVDDFKAWRQRQNVGMHTVNSSLRVLRPVLHRATLERLRAPLIKGEIVVLPGAQSRERVVSPAEEKAYLAACTEPLKTIATVLVDTGLRPEESLRLKWEFVTFDKDGGRIFNEHGKSKAARRSVSMTKTRPWYPVSALECRR
jgi:integrase